MSVQEIKVGGGIQLDSFDALAGNANVIHARTQQPDRTCAHSLRQVS